MINLYHLIHTLRHTRNYFIIFCYFIWSLAQKGYCIRAYKNGSLLTILTALFFPTHRSFMKALAVWFHKHCLLNPLIIFSTVLFLMKSTDCKAQSVAINNDGSPPDPSALLDIKSSTHGLLVPRMSSAERLAIATPGIGLLVFDTDTNSFWYNAVAGWTEITSAAAMPNYWSANGAHIYNNNSGNVGIGTSSPSHPLEILTPDASWGMVQTNGTDQVGTFTGSGAGWLATQSNSPLYFGTSLNNANTSPQISLLTNGNVGIGTTAPATKLQVNTIDGSRGIIHSNGSLTLGTYIGGGAGWLGTFTNQPLYLFTNNAGAGQLNLLPNGNVGIGTIAPSSRLEVNTANANWGIIHTNGFERVGTYVGGGGGWVATQSNSPLYFCTSLLGLNGSAQMTLLTNGNFGIGTINPSYKLQVNTGDGLPGIVHSNGLISVGTYVGSNGGWLGTFSNNPLYFFTNNGNAQMTLLPNGYLGIGTINPTYPLAVNGVIRCKEVRVESGWADYVFDGTYKLPSLESVSRYIKENKHLQGIPSAGEIQKTGLAVGEVQSKMMEKIEELSLYIIDMNNTINELSKRIKDLEGSKPCTKQ